MAKKRRLVWTQRAKADLRNIRGYIAQHAPRNADSVVRRIRERCKGLCAQAYAAPMVEEIGSHTFRETYYGSYRVMYEVTPDAVVITSVFHGSQQFSKDRLIEPDE